MAASFPGTIKIFSTKAPGQAIASSHINELQDEVAAVETQLVTSKLASLSAAPVGDKVLTSVAGVPTWAAKAPDSDKLDGKTYADLMKLVYPVGSIYMSVSSTNPGTLFGGTWVTWGAGRVPVGIDAGDTSFDTVEETGGEKTHVLTTAELAAHKHATHSSGTATTFGLLANYNVAATGSDYALKRVDTSEPDVGTTSTVGSNTAHNNLQPYIVCYMFKRTA